MLQLEAVPDLRVAVLGDEPEAVVLDGIDAREQRAVERRAEHRQHLLDHAASPPSLEPVLRGPARAPQLPLRDLGSRVLSGRLGRDTQLGGHRLVARYLVSDRVGIGVALVLLVTNDALEHVEDQRIELTTSLLAHHRERLLDGQREAVDAVGRERVEDVGDRGDAPLERDRFSGEPVRIAVSVPALVVDERNRRRQLEDLRRGAAQEPVADLGMALHRAPLLVGEAVPLEKDLVGDGDLADVVQRTGIAQEPAAFLVESEPPRDQLAHPRHSLGVVSGLGIAELGGVRELPDRLGLGTAELELGATQPGDRVEELFLGPTPLCQFGLKALVETRVVECDRRHSAEPVEERDLFRIEAGGAAAREADDAEDAFGSAQRRADDRAHRHRPELLRTAHVAPLVSDGQRLVCRRDLTCEPLPDLNREPDLRFELTDPRHDRKRLAVRLEQVEKRFLDADERCRPGQDQVEELGISRRSATSRAVSCSASSSARGKPGSSRRPSAHPSTDADD